VEKREKQSQETRFLRVRPLSEHLASWLSQGLAGRKFFAPWNLQERKRKLLAKAQMAHSFLPSQLQQRNIKEPPLIAVTWCAPRKCHWPPHLKSKVHVFSLQRCKSYFHLRGLKPSLNPQKCKLNSEKLLRRFCSSSQMTFQNRFLKMGAITKSFIIAEYIFVVWEFCKILEVSFAIFLYY